MKKNNCKPFKTSFALQNRHVQTLYSSLFRKERTLETTIEKFELSDGDFVECFWYNKPPTNSSTPIAILFHGLEGSYKSPYIQGVMLELQKEGIASVLMHFRGCSGVPNRFARAYHSGDTADALEWITYVKKSFKNSKLFGVGYSLGANMLLKLLGELKENSLLSGAVSVSAPLQLDLSANKMNSGFSKFYQYHLLRSLRRSLKAKYNDHDMSTLIKLQRSKVKELSSFWEFDDVYTAKIHGFSSASEYYEKSSAKQFLKDIRTPTLIIHALDDPFMTPAILPKSSELSKSVTMQVSANGGHVGFIGGSFLKPEFWLEKRVVSFVKSLKVATKEPMS
ncbi:MAG: hydrolase [Helicobacteraceae bacterium]|nr:hydrolase [Helicobacteraceae bacterium]